MRISPSRLFTITRIGDRAAGKIMEGVFAVNKPQGISSAQVLRNLQTHFDPSNLFAPTIQAEAQRLDEPYRQQSYKKTRGRKKMTHIKIGHGGTLDPLATGVLITGIGSGTKSLQNFLGCTKTYETTVLFGVATDTYDILGKVITRKDFAHITKDKVLAMLAEMKEVKMQRPPIYSALRHEGKRFYEYAREGKDLPIDIPERPVEITELEMTAWMEGGEHGFAWPSEDVEAEVKAVADKAMEAVDVPAVSGKGEAEAVQSPELKRKRDGLDEGSAGEPATKRIPADEPLMSGALPVVAQAKEVNIDSASVPASSAAKPPACKIRMTVSSGFYVRSLCHDLGRELGSAALMAELVRTRQQDFQLGKNVFEYSELTKGEHVWAPQVEKLLDEWNSKSPGAQGARSPPRYEGGSSQSRQERDGQYQGQKSKPNGARGGERRRNSSSPE